MSGATVPSLRVARRHEHVMGMPISVALRGRHSVGPVADDAWQEVLASLRDADRTFSTYRPDSEISRFGRGEIAEHDLRAEVVEVLAIAARAERATDGAFSAWLPDARGARTLDPSAVVKGWAVERAATALRTLEATDFCLSAGGDLTGRATEGPPWRIGIEDPHDPQRLLATVPIVDGAVATSGTAHRGAHLVDARTGRPPTDIAQVTVIARSLTWADVDATAAYALGPDAATWLRHRVGRTGLVVRTDGTTVTTGGDGDRHAHGERVGLGTRGHRGG